MSTETAQVQEVTQAATPAPESASELQPGATAPADGGAGEEGAAEAELAEQQKQQDEERQKRNRERFDRRFSDLSRAKRDAELRAARLEGELEALRRQPRPEPQQPQAPEERAPNPRDYPKGEFDPRYVKDLAKHELRQELRQEQEAEAQKRAEAERQASEERTIAEGRQRFEGVLSEAQAMADEHDWAQRAPEVLELAFVPVNQGGLPRYAVDAITSSDNPVHVAEVLGRDPRRLDALRRADRDSAIRMIGALDAQIALALKPAATPATKPSKPQATPAPIPSTSGAGAAPSFNPEKASFSEFEQHFARVRGNA